MRHLTADTDRLHYVCSDFYEISPASLYFHDGRNEDCGTLG
jgi:nicotinic acid phosphoribosyltransferase